MGWIGIECPRPSDSDSIFGCIAGSASVSGGIEADGALIRTHVLCRIPPLPDETDRSYLGALMRVNGFQTETEFREHVAKWTSIQNWNRTSVPTVELLATVATTQIEDFARHHTLIPLRRGITAHLPTVIHGCANHQTLLRQTNFGQRRGRAFFCSECVAPDQQMHGRSYWRREHQVPGLSWCPKHRVPLRIALDKTAVLKSPSRFIDSKEADSFEQIQKWIEVPSIKTYLDVCSSLLDTAKPFDARAVRIVLKRQAKNRGIRSMHTTAKRHPNSPSVSDIAWRIFPAEWLKSVLEITGSEGCGSELPQLETAVRQAGGGTFVSYALAIATLFESADDAMAVLGGSTQTKIRRPAGEINLTRERLLSLYTQCGGNYSQVSALTGIGYGSVSRRLVKMGLPALRAEHGRLLLPAIDMFLLHVLSLEQSAKSSGVPLERLELFLREACTPLLSLFNTMFSKRPERTIGAPRERLLATKESR